MADTSPILPPHSIRYSARARRISLRVLPDKGLEIVLPRYTDPSCVPAILHKHKDWIATHLDRLHAGGDGRFTLPGCLVLRGGKEIVHLVMPDGEPVAAPAPQVKQPLTGPAPVEKELRLPPLKSGDTQQYASFLRRWLQKEAARELGSMLARLADEHGFRYSRVSVRFQKSRWGSCSSKKSISLNACLLFLPEDLIRHILLHELCHTVAMNHKDAFWKVLFSVEPDALAKDKAMRAAWRYVPGWVLSA